MAAAQSGINLAQLSQILVTTLGTDNAARKQVEVQLHGARLIPGYLPALMTLVTHSGANSDVKQTAASALQTAVKRYWSNSNPQDPSPFSEADKAVVRAGIVELVLGADIHSVMTFCIETIAHIALDDFPDRWEGLVPVLTTALQQPNIKIVYRTARIIRRISKMYQYLTSDSGERTPWEMLIRATYPHLLAVFQQCITSNSLDAANVMRMVLKCYWGAIHRALSGHLADPTVFTNWITLVNTLLAKPLPEASEGLEPAGQPTDSYDRYNWPWWKCKKWCACILDRIMNRYGTPEWVPDSTSDTYRAAQLFHDRFAATILASVWGNLQLRLKGRFVTDRVFVHCLSYVKVGMEFGAVWSQLRESKGVILQDLILGTLKYKAEDVALWTEDPDEFIRTYYSTLDDYYDPRVEVKNLLWYCVATRGKAFMPYIQSTFDTFLTQYAAQPAESRDWTVKEAVLACLQSLSGKFLQNAAYRPGVPGMLVAHVIPEMNSPLGPMRARAVSVVGDYVPAAFDAATWRAIVTRVIELMRDPESVVQYVAAATFNQLLKNPTTKDVMRPMVVDILNTLFALVAKFKADEVVSALASVFAAFPEECNAQGTAVVAKLCDFFVQFSLAAANSKDEDGDHLEFAALNCLTGIQTVMDATHYTPERMASFISSAGSLAVKLMDPNADLVHWDYIQSAMDFIYTLGFNTPVGGLTADHWLLFERAAAATLTYGSDFADVFASTTEPFICKGIDTLLTAKASPALPAVAGKPLVSLIFQVHQHMVATQSEVEQVYTTRPLCSVLLKATGGRADALVPDLLTHFVKLGVDVGTPPPAKTNDLKVACVTVLGAAMISSPAVVVAWLEANGAALHVLKAFAATTQMGLSQLDKKVASAGLLSLAGVLPPASPLLPDLLATAGLLAYQDMEGLTGEYQEDDSDDESDEEDGGGVFGGRLDDPEGPEAADTGPVVLGEIELADTADVDHSQDAAIHAAIEAMPPGDGLGVWDEGPSPLQAAENDGSAEIKALDLPQAFFKLLQTPALQALVPVMMTKLPDDDARAGVNKMFTQGQASASGVVAGAGGM